MPTDIPLRCACGELRGTAFAVSPSAGSRLVCYCNDCQAFARFLGRPGVTDEQGGTEVYQMAPGRVRITAGVDVLRCVRLSERGLHRWYCGGCKTPVGNTMGARVPFVGLIYAIMDLASRDARDQALGEPIAHVKKQGAIGRLPPHPRDMSLPRLIARTVRLLATWKLTGVGSPSPFFDAHGAPRTPPQVLTPEQRRALT